MISFKNLHRCFVVFAALSAISFAPVSSYAAGEGPKPPEQDWSFDGMFGTYDRAAMQRGLKVYRQVCAACHGMKHLAYRNLTMLGYTENQVKNIAAEYMVMDGPDEEGEMFERPALPSDHFVSPYANDNQAKATNNGALPPDLSLITKARPNGADYLYALLTGYEEAPEGKELMAGQYWNKYMPGHVIAMAPPLTDDIVMYEDGTPQTVEQYSKDVTHFLKWAADPYMEDRKRIGLRVLIFLLVFAGVMYAYKRKIWSDQH
ncbi:MAG: cytochrome c1 [Alphaproteobacteria bacterium]